MNEELTSEIVEKIIPRIEKYLAQAQQEAVERERKETITKIRKWGKMLEGGANEWLIDDLLEALQKEEK